MAQDLTPAASPALPMDRAPRYTSYPTAAQFHAGIGSAEAERWIADLRPDAPVSLYVHIPFCHSMCWYCACNKKLAAREEPVIAYAEALVREIELLAAKLPARMPVGRLHFGGGTPHSLPMASFSQVMDALERHFDLSGTSERAVEIDPRTFDAAWAPLLAKRGFKRASLGVQELDPRVQETINRVQPFGQISTVVEDLRGSGFSAINFDLMYGLPHQTTDSLAATVERVLALRPDRIALFGYAHVPWMAPVQKRIPEDALPGRDERVAQASMAARVLVREGYQPIGLDHFALPHDSLAHALKAGTLRRNFQGYTDDPCETVLGLGASAITTLPSGFVQSITEPGAWRRAVDGGALPVARGVALSNADRLRARVIEAIMCRMEVDLAFEAFRAGEDPCFFADELIQLTAASAAGLVEIHHQRLRVTEKGRTGLRAIAAIFDQHLRTEAAGRHALAV